MDIHRNSGLWKNGMAPSAAAADNAPDPDSSPVSPRAASGPYQYYQPPPPRATDAVKRSFSERAPALDESPVIGHHGIFRADSKKDPEAAIAAAKLLSEGLQQGPVRDTLATQPAATSAQLAQTKHVADVDGPPALHIDPDYVPDNLRASAWSPDMMSPRTTNTTTNTTSKSQPQTKPRQGSIPTTAAEGPRRSSVPDRSPLQNLESWSKEEKRARIEQAEKRARQRSLSGQGGDSGAAGRIASEGAPRKPSRRDRDDRRPRLASEGAAPRDDEAARRPPQHKANNAVKTSKVPAQEVSSPKMRRAQLVENGASSDPRGPDSGRASLDLGRNHSRHYRQGSRESGAMDPAAQEAAAERGKAAYERRKSLMQDNLPSPTSPVSPVTPEGGGFGQSYGVSDARPPAQRLSGDHARTKQPLQTGGVSRSVSKSTRSTAAPALPPDAASGRGVLNTANDAVKYAVPPQAPAAREAREQVGFDSKPLPPIDTKADKKRHRFGDFLHHGHRDHRSYTESSKPLDDWRKAGVARLTTEDLDFEATVSAAVAAALAANKEHRDATWWEKGHSRRPSGGSASASAATKNIPDLSQYDGPYEEKANGFQPRLFLKCGPLLRYTGIRTETAAPAGPSREGAPPAARKEVWHGTIMIVTQDDRSDLTRTPSLRLFAQPMTLHDPAPRAPGADSAALLPEAEDPVAGTVKLSRTGRALYVRPVHDIEPGVDLSREESNHGLYAATRTPILGPQASTGADGRQSQHITFQDKNRVQNRDGEKARRYREVKATKLHSEQGCTFWRFAVAIELTDAQHRVAYRINKGPAVAFWVPARGETMNMMFHSCNGFSYSVAADNFCGPDPLWRDVLNRHQHRPFHVMIGGGDQIYNDAAMHETTLFKDWLRIKNPEHKHHADFTIEMQRELEAFYLNRYSMWFSQGLFGAATSQIPMVNIWDDHDIIDGYGSYPDSSMSTRVFTGLGAVAFKYYMLFQHQSLPTETEKEEPSWLLGEHPGPYINQVSRSLFLRLGPKVAFLGLDCRTERKRDEILCQETYDLVFDRCRAEITKDGPIKHLLVLLGVPIAYPRLNFLENILTSRVMDPVKALRRAGLLGGFVNKIDGGVEILDDLDDHWTAKHHKAERNWFIQELQELAAEKSVRITILGGDVHLGAVGQFYSNKKLGIRKDRDHRYMPNVISSAIVNTPPPNMMADVLNQRNKVHHLDEETDEDLIPMFEHDVDGSRRGNRHLLPRRNFCMIREWVPGSTPPPSPKLKPAATAPLPTPDEPVGGEPDGGEWGGKRDRRFPPGSMRRTMSLSRVPNLVRRLSGASRRRPNISGPIPQDYQQQQEQAMQRANSFSGPGLEGRRSASFTAGDDERPMFLRRPTNLSEKEVRKAVAKGGANAEFDAHIDLQDGLDISLCMEIDQHDPAGTTMPYRLLVPALRYEGPGDLNTATFQSHRRSFMDRLRGFRVRETPKNPEDYEESFLGDDGELQSVRLNSRTSSPFTPTTANTIANTGRNSAAAGLGLTTTGRGAPSSRLAMGDGYDDTDDGYDDHHNGAAAATATAPQAYTSQHSYNKGLSLSLPPIGATATTAAPSHNLTAPASNTAAAPASSYPQSGYRRAPQQQPQPPAATAAAARSAAPQQDPRRYSYDEDDRSFTTEQYYDDDFDQDPRLAQQQQRRPQPAAVPRAQHPYFGGDGGAEGAVPAAGNAPVSGGGGFFRKLSLQHDRRSTEGGRPFFSSAASPGAGGAALGREGSVQKKGWKKLWKQPRGEE